MWEIIFQLNIKLYSSRYNLPMIIYGSLARISAEIDCNDFLQEHRSYIANVSKISAVTFKSLTMCNIEIIPVERKYQILLDIFFK
jgi:two-component system LytT family response regulator